LLDNAVMGVAYFNKHWIALGQGGPFSMATSSDGVSWTGVPNSVRLFDLGLSALWSPSLGFAIAVGQGAFPVAVSRDGISWTGVTAPFDDVFALASNETIAR
jgi:hypothetical protein